jgi:hypothetical protein
VPLRTNKIISCAARFSDYVASMYWQQVASLAIVGVAAALFLRALFRPRKFSFQRETHCGGCSLKGSGAAPQYSVVYHTRKGERPEILIKPK